MDEQKREPALLGEVIQAGQIGFHLDWVAYFREFCRVNGDNPVLYNDNGVSKLLFRTGWGYSAVNHAGPEYPPPQEPDKLTDLVIFYWFTRRRELVEIREQLASSVSGLESLQNSRSVPLQVREMHWDDVQKRSVTRHGDIQMEQLYNRLQRLDDLIVECNAQLTHHSTNHHHPASSDK